MHVCKITENSASLALQKLKWQKAKTMAPAVALLINFFIPQHSYDMQFFAQTVISNFWNNY